MNQLARAYQHCETIIAHHSKSFYKAFSLLAPADRKAVWAVYAFCRTVDDIVDEGTNPAVELAQFTFEFERFLAGHFDRSHLMWVALEDVFKRYDMDALAFRDLITGQEMDLTIHRYDTVDELLHYCYHVASTVGLMLLPILAPTKINELRESAISLGLAMQITNILRDIGEDFDRNRIYLPQQLMHQCQLAEMSLQLKEVTPSFIEVWEHLAERAERYYEQAFQFMHVYPSESRMAVHSSALFYRHILSAVRLSGYDVFSEKRYVSDDAKKRILQQLLSV